MKNKDLFSDRADFECGGEMSGSADNFGIKRKSSLLDQRFDRDGLRGFTPVGVMELLLELTSAKSPASSARRLIFVFGDIKGILKADIRMLQRAGGLDVQSAAFIKAVSAVLDMYAHERRNKGRLPGVRALMKIFLPCFSEAGAERLVLACFDSSIKLLGIRIIGRGTSDCTPAKVKSAIRSMAGGKCTLAAIAHNHPYVSCVPSPEDAALTRQLCGIMNVMGVYLMDHIIFGCDGSYSMRSHGDLSIFD